jgi:hypothetical protein
LEVGPADAELCRAANPETTVIPAKAFLRESPHFALSVLLIFRPSGFQRAENPKPLPQTTQTTN